MMKISAIFTRNWGRIPYVTPAAFTRAIRRSTRVCVNYPCPFPARKLHGLSCTCKEPVRFLEEETDEEDDFEEFDFMMFSQLEDTRDVLSGFCRTANCRCRSA